LGVEEMKNEVVFT